MAIVTKSTEINGTPFSIETGRIAKQAHGSVVVRMGDSMVMVNAVGADDAKPGTDFLPLTCEYRPGMYAAGKIPGGFFKREGKPTEKAILVSRLMDRPMRPLFPKTWRAEIQIFAQPISHDIENNTDVLAVTGASAAVHISDLPFDGPIAAVRVGRIDGKFIANPTKSQLEKSDFNMVVAATKDAITMVEGGMHEASEKDVVAALDFGFQSCQPLIALQDELRAAAGKEKRATPKGRDVSLLLAEIEPKYASKIAACFDMTGKHGRRDGLAAVGAEIQAAYALPESASDEDKAERKAALSDVHGKLVKKVMRNRLLDTTVRLDGRAPDEIRAISIEVGVLPRAHGSALFTRGETQALVVTTLGTRMDEQRVEELDETGWNKFMLHYNFPGYSVGETRRISGPGRRETGHGALARRALEPVLPAHEKFAYTLRIVSEITESNGSSSMASVCGGSLSLMDAGVPTKAAVAGIAMGLVKEGDRFCVLSDIAGDEDHLGDMDFKVTGTQKGVTAFQMDTKIKGVNAEIMTKALHQAREGRIYILDKMEAAIAAPRGEMSPWAPRITKITINKERIKDIIGPGGKTIRGMVEATGAQIDVADDGTVTIASSDGAATDKAIKMIRELTQEAEIGKLYLGVVKKVVDFGAFVEIFPGTEGLVHISQLAKGRVNKVTDVLQEGDEVLVKCLEVDKSGKIRLSRSAALGDQLDGNHAAPSA